MKPVMRIRSVTALVLSVVMLASCSRSLTKPSLISEVTTIEITTEETSSSPEETGDAKTAVPKVEKIEDNIRQITFSRDGNEFDGVLVLPDGEGPYKTIVLCAPLYTFGWDIIGRAYEYAEKGYAAIVFDFQDNMYDGGSPKYIGDFIYQNVLDLYAVMDALKYLPDVDTSNVYLWGHSMGGLTAAYAGALRKDDIKGMILVEPSIQNITKMKFEGDAKLDADLYSLWKEMDIPVVIIRGTHDGLGSDPDFFNEAMASLKKGKLITIDGADHYMTGSYGKLMTEKSVEEIKSWN